MILDAEGSPSSPPWLCVALGEGPGTSYTRHRTRCCRPTPLIRKRAAPGTDLTALDLASRLIDGEEIFVGIPPPSGVAAQSGGGVIGDNTGGVLGGSAATVVDLNTSTQAELETLPGVGAVTAQKILDWRAQHGRFTSVGQLQQVSGIGPSKYAALVGRVKV